jgi:hypothetical protein
MKYGCWISPLGQVFEIETILGHDLWLKQRQGELHLRNESEAWDCGWISITCYGVSWRICFSHPTQSALKETRKILKENQNSIQHYDIMTQSCITLTGAMSTLNRMVVDHKENDKIIQMLS